MCLIDSIDLGREQEYGYKKANSVALIVSVGNVLYSEN